MKTFNPLIHHRRSIRLKGYDYSQAGLYFITICCQDRRCLFGEIIDGKMILNEYGQIAYDEWVKTPEIRKNVELGEFIIMPNHIHGIIRLFRRGESHSPEIINESHSPLINGSQSTGESHSPQRSPEIINGIQSTDESHSPQRSPEIINGIQSTGESHSPLRSPEIINGIQSTGESHSPPRSPSQTIGAIVRGYKSSVTKQLNALNFGCSVWQRNYYEHIIRDEQSYKRISEYIINNPNKWSEVKFKGS
jgi:REP element-mobilizing transposase RayT